MLNNYLDEINLKAQALTHSKIKTLKGKPIEFIWPEINTEKILPDIRNVLKTNTPFVSPNLSTGTGDDDDALFFKLIAFALPDKRLAVIYEDRNVTAC